MRGPKKHELKLIVERLRRQYALSERELKDREAYWKAVEKRSAECNDLARELQKQNAALRAQLAGARAKDDDTLSRTGG